MSSVTAWIGQRWAENNTRGGLNGLLMVALFGLFLAGYLGVDVKKMLEDGLGYVLGLQALLTGAVNIRGVTKPDVQATVQAVTAAAGAATSDWRAEPVVVPAALPAVAQAVQAAPMPSASVEAVQAAVAPSVARRDPVRLIERRPVLPLDLLTHTIRPVLAEMAARDRVPDGLRTQKHLLAICGQETDFMWTRQVLRGNRPGPATGRWQFERGGGVAGVMTHARTEPVARRWCERQGVPFERGAVWEALENDDALACAFARLLLWSDPRPLPADQDAAWEYYRRNWKPGKPHPQDWPDNWQLAEATMRQAGALVTV